ncbi:MAG: hypothetical protein AAGL17_11840 [Cyanobacteria bacterium J06576_12]
MPSMRPTPKKQSASSPKSFAKKRKGLKLPRWIGVSVLLGGITGASMAAGALLAVSLGTQPLLQSNLTAEEAAVFSQDEPIATANSLQLPTLTRPVNILLLGVKVTSSDVQDYDAIYEDGYDSPSTFVRVSRGTDSTLTRSSRGSKRSSSMVSDRPSKELTRLS